MDDSASPDPVTARRAAQAAAFDRIGIRYDEVFPHKDGQEELIDSLLERLPAASRVLDVGCGTGLPTARQLVAAGHAVTGLDISPVMLDLACRNVPEATFLLRDAEENHPSIGRFDAVVAFFSLLMLPRASVVQTLARCRQVLSPDGWLATGMVEVDLDDAELPFLGQAIRVTGWPRDELNELLDAGGFTVKVEKTRSYEPSGPGAPPELQLFFLAQQSA